MSDEFTPSAEFQPHDPLLRDELYFLKLLGQNAFPRPESTTPAAETAAADTNEIRSDTGSVMYRYTDAKGRSISLSITPGDDGDFLLTRTTAPTPLAHYRAPDYNIITLNPGTMEQVVFGEPNRGRVTEENPNLLCPGEEGVWVWSPLEVREVTAPEPSSFGIVSSYKQLEYERAMAEQATLTAANLDTCTDAADAIGQFERNRAATIGETIHTWLSELSTYRNTPNFDQWREGLSAAPDTSSDS